MTNVIDVTVAALQPTVAALRSQPVGVMEAVDQLPRMTSVEFVAEMVLLMAIVIVMETNLTNVVYVVEVV